MDRSVVSKALRRISRWSNVTTRFASSIAGGVCSNPFLINSIKVRLSLGASRTTAFSTRLPDKRRTTKPLQYSWTDFNNTLSFGTVQSTLAIRSIPMLTALSTAPTAATRNTDSSSMPNKALLSASNSDRKPSTRDAMPPQTGTTIVSFISLIRSHTGITLSIPLINCNFSTKGANTSASKEEIPRRAHSATKITGMWNRRNSKGFICSMR